MTYTFTDQLPTDADIVPMVISGTNSMPLNGKAYLKIQQNNDQISWYEIRYTHHCSPFKAVIVTDNILAAGHEEHFYLFDLSTSTPLLCLKMSGYFGALYINQHHFYVSDADALYCIDKAGNLIWQNDALGIDGVTVHRFTENEIFGAGEWDPPGHWKEFILDRKNGKPVS